jgi:hypothetical protein
VVPLGVPAIVRHDGSKVQLHAETAPSEAPTSNDRKPAIVTTKPKVRRKAWADDGRETLPEIKALIERMMLGRGPGSSR